MNTTVKGTSPLTAGNSVFNAISQLTRNAIRGQVNTAIPVRVDTVEAGGTGPVGHLSATPLVSQTDGQGRAVAPRSLPRLPYCRLQGGVAALIVDPQPGDIGIAVFAQQDISGVSAGAADPVPPGSFRAFDMADGLYIGGILNRAPEVWIEITQNHTVRIHAPEKILLETKQLVIDAAESVCINTQTYTVNAAGRVDYATPHYTLGGEGSGAAATLNVDLSLRGNISQQGSHTSTGDQIASGISQANHVHSGVQAGASTTGTPV